MFHLAFRFLSLGGTRTIARDHSSSNNIVHFILAEAEVFRKARKPDLMLRSFDFYPAELCSGEGLAVHDILHVGLAKACISPIVRRLAQ